MRWWNGLMALFAFVGFAAYGADNQKLADVMNLLLDQSNGLGELSRKVPAEVDARTFDRALSRARAGSWLSEKLKQDAGKIVDGKLEVADLTPGKLKDAAPEALEELFTKYTDAMVDLAAKFTAAETTLKAQSQLEPAKRDFTELKTAVKNLALAMAAGHKIFKPSPTGG